MRSPSILAARPLLALAVLLAGIGSVVALTDDGAGPDRDRLSADAPPSSTTSSSTTSTTSSVVVDPTTSVLDPSTTTTIAPPPTSVVPRSTTTLAPIPTTMPPPTTVVTLPPTGIPAGAARVLLVNETDVPLDVAVNQAWLRMAPGQTEEGFIVATLGASNAAPGTDIVVAAIPTNYGLRDEGCGSDRLGQLITPGRSYKIRFYNSGTCQLLGGGPKPTIAITQR